MTPGHPRLHAAGHAIADSLGSGLSFLAGTVFCSPHADASRHGMLVIDVLHGVIVSGRASDGTVRAAADISARLSEILRRHRLSPDDFAELVISFHGDVSRLCDVQVTSPDGRTSQRRYHGRPLRSVLNSWVKRPGRVPKKRPSSRLGRSPTGR